MPEQTTGAVQPDAALTAEAIAVMREFEATENAASRAVSMKLWGHPGGFVAEHHVGYGRLAGALVDAGWRPPAADGALALTDAERMVLAGAVYSLTGHLPPRGENDLSSVRNAVELAVEDILRTRGALGDRQTTPTTPSA